MPLCLPLHLVVMPYLPDHRFRCSVVALLFDPLGAYPHACASATEHVEAVHVGGVQGKLFKEECTTTFPDITSLQLPENYRSVPSVVRASIAILRTTSAGRPEVPLPMRAADIQPLFVSNGTVEVRFVFYLCWHDPQAAGFVCSVCAAGGFVSCAAACQ